MKPSCAALEADVLPTGQQQGWRYAAVIPSAPIRVASVRYTGTGLSVPVYRNPLKGQTSLCLSLTRTHMHARAHTHTHAHTHAHTHIMHTLPSPLPPPPPPRTYLFPSFYLHVTSSSYLPSVSVYRSCHYALGSATRNPPNLA